MCGIIKINIWFLSPVPGPELLKGLEFNCLLYANEMSLEMELDARIRTQKLLAPSPASWEWKGVKGEFNHQ